MNTRGKRNERGASAVEYGLKVALIGVFLITVLQVLGFGLAMFFESCASPGIEKGYHDAAAGEGCG